MEMNIDKYRTKVIALLTNKVTLEQWGTEKKLGDVILVKIGENRLYQELSVTDNTKAFIELDFQHEKMTVEVVTRDQGSESCIYMLAIPECEKMVKFLTDTVVSQRTAEWLKGYFSGLAEVIDIDEEGETYEDILKFIAGFKDKGVIECFTSGYCYWFAYILMTRFCKLEPDIMYDPVVGHFITRIKGTDFDVTGDVSGKYHPFLWERDSKAYEYSRVFKDCILKK